MIHDICIHLKISMKSTSEILLAKNEVLALKGYRVLHKPASLHWPERNGVLYNGRKLHCILGTTPGQCSLSKVA